ncbi:MAG: nucleoside 2-deoxyribosyltransferase [Endozoicomonas sp. (ex Botrylloides leachii)]|nr:nucleoside 2-deoxyribosyltransferase [Endozoicomonas sp. (ex Botrylloides leachii)]
MSVKFNISSVFISLLAIFSYYAYGDKPKYSVYLAGPDVFLQNPINVGEELKNKIIAFSNQWVKDKKYDELPFDLDLKYPMDSNIDSSNNSVPNKKMAADIYNANIKMMDASHIMLANTTNFRGPEMDTGTAFEVGYMSGIKKPVFAYFNTQPFWGKSFDISNYLDRVKQMMKLNKESVKDKYSVSIENFGTVHNIMIDCSVKNITTELRDAVNSALDYLDGEYQKSISSHSGPTPYANL